MCQPEGSYFMFKNKISKGRCNISGLKIKELRQAHPSSPSQRQFADYLQLEGIDLDKNAIQRIEAGKRFVTDIELKAIAKVLNVTADALLEEPLQNENNIRAGLPN